MNFNFESHRYRIQFKITSPNPIEGHSMNIVLESCLIFDEGLEVVLIRFDVVTGLFPIVCVISFVVF